MATQSSACSPRLSSAKAYAARSGFGSATLDESTTRSKSVSCTSGLSASASEAMLASDVVVTRATFTPLLFASRTVSATPSRGEISDDPRLRWKSSDFERWIAAASTSSPIESA